MTHHADRARRGIEAAAQATELLTTVVRGLDDAGVRAPSLLPGWSRAHVITHLARNADGLVNLLTWARTGVEHQMYTSREDRDAAIVEGASRGRLLLAEDLDAAQRRFAVAARALPDSAWDTTLALRGRPVVAASVPWLRMREVWFHLIDLDAGVGFDAVPGALHAGLIDDVVEWYADRGDVPAVTVRARLADGDVRSWRLNGTAGPTVSGDSAALLGWLTGRGAGTDLTGPLPALPPWA